MSLRNLVDSQLRKAFILAKDLATDATFNKKVVSGFNFGTAAVVATPGDTTPAKVVITKITRKDGYVTKTFMVRSSEIGKLNDYAKVVIDGLTYDFGEILKDSGFILMASVFRQENQDG